MKSVLVLGGTGMLGSMVTDELARTSGIRLTATYRPPSSGGRPRPLDGVSWVPFDGLSSAAVDQLAASGRFDWIVNAIGLTKPLIHDDNSAEIERAIHINSILPHLVANFARDISARALQIATDCVYSGAKGSYSETDPHDALDVYGKTKSLGECHRPEVSHLRCSIIGPEPKDYKFLIEWFRRQPSGATVNGFVNHNWNGVTTLHFARLCRGVIESDLALDHIQHIVPAGAISKAGMLHEFAAAFRRSDIMIRDCNAATVIDRTLATRNPDLNAALWNAAGYHIPPTVPEMISELARYDYRFAC